MHMVEGKAAGAQRQNQFWQPAGVEELTCPIHLPDLCAHARRSTFFCKNQKTGGKSAKKCERHLYSQSSYAVQAAMRWDVMLPIWLLRSTHKRIKIKTWENFFPVFPNRQWGGFIRSKKGIFLFWFEGAIKWISFLLFLPSIEPKCKQFRTFNLFSPPPWAPSFSRQKERCVKNCFPNIGDLGQPARPRQRCFFVVLAVRVDHLVGVGYESHTAKERI